MIRRKKLLFSAMAFVLVMAVVEGAAGLVVGYLREKGVVYGPAPVAAADYAEYLARRDPHTGWPAPSFYGVTHAGERRYDDAGARPDPRFPSADGACVSTCGDSFTFGYGVADEAAWGSLLSQRLGCRVANFGVGGFGTDQVLIRFEHNDRDLAPIVILGHLSENILRNVNQLRNLLASGTRFGLKPRFVATADGGLELIPIPSPTLGERRAIVDRPEDALPHEFFVPGGHAGVLRAGFPNVLVVALTVGNHHVRTQLSGVPRWFDFYDEGHPSGGLETTARIMERFTAVARARGREPMLQIIPSGLDFTHHRDRGEWPYAPLVARLEAAGVDLVDHGERLLARLGDRDPCEIYLSCDNHLNAEGNAMLAAEVEAAPRERDLWPPGEVDGDPAPP